MIFNFSPIDWLISLELQDFFFLYCNVDITPLWLLFVNNPDWVPEFMKFVLITDDITVPVLFTAPYT